MAGRDDENPPWGSDEKGSPMVVVAKPQNSNVGAIAARTAMNLSLILFMLFVVGLAVAAFFLRIMFEDRYANEAKLTSRPAAEVVKYSDDLTCVIRALEQGQYEVLRLVPRGTTPREGDILAGTTYTSAACGYTVRAPDPPAPAPAPAAAPARGARAAAATPPPVQVAPAPAPRPIRVIFPLAPEASSLQERIDALRRENQRLRLEITNRTSYPNEPRPRRNDGNGGGWPK